jgi:hypothetical protein
MTKNGLMNIAYCSLSKIDLEKKKKRENGIISFKM